MPTEPTSPSADPPSRPAMTDGHDPMVDGEEPPPRGVRAMAIVRWTILGLAAMTAIASWWSFALAQTDHARAAAAAPKYHCPMHPHIVGDQPGECPICHMNLEPMTAERGGAQTREHGASPAETTPIELSLDRIQAIGVRTALVSEKVVTPTLRVTAVVAAADQGASEVHARTSGFVEKILVNETGVTVAAGQAMVLLYSPEIYQAEAELLASRHWTTDAGGATSSSARYKLELLGMTGSDLDEVLEKGVPLRDVHVLAPQGGVVEKKSVVLGSFVTPEATLYQIQDLSRVYVLAEVFQRDMREVHAGLKGQFVAAAHQDKPVQARVDLIYPAVDAQARTTRVRMQVANPGRAFLPGEYGTVEFAMPPAKVLTVPPDAVIDTGKSTYVFVVESEGRFAPRAVVLAPGEDDDVTIAGGLNVGDRVVSGATFLIDSESRLQASIAATGQVGSTPGGGPSEGGPSCDADVDRQKYPDRYVECQKCARIHHGMGSMEADCKNAIPKPWK